MVSNTPRPSLPILRSTIASVIKLALDPRRLPWIVSMVLSVLYFVFYFKNLSDGGLPCKYQPSGFCVTNYVPPTIQKKTEVPIPGTGYCPSKVENSHFWAFSVDVLFTIAVLIIGFNPEIFMEQQGFANAVMLAFVIIFHGGLHFFLGYVLQCKDEESAELPAQTFLYAAFIFVLAYVTFRSTSSVKFPLSLILSVAFTFLIVKASASSDNVGAIFGGTQLLVAFITVFFPKNTDNFGTQKQGWFFVAPCVISLWELLGCCDDSGDKGLFNKIGGHVWYDITLHTALIVTQLTPETKKKDK